MPSMSVIIVLILISLLLASGFLFAYFWSVKTGQYDDEITPSVRILYENRSDDHEKDKQSTI